MGKAEAMASAQVRRGRIVSDLMGSKKPLSGAALAKELWQPIVAMFWRLRGSRRYL